MNKLIFMILICFNSVLLIGQDLLVTSDGDSIHCKVKKYNSENIKYFIKEVDSIRFVTSPITYIKTMKLNYYSIPEILGDELINETKIKFSLNGGNSYLMARIDGNLSSDLKEYIKELKTGYNVQGSIHFFSSNKIGYGSIVSIFKTKNKIPSVDLKDDITISYIGPSFHTMIEDRFGYYYSSTTISVGYIQYHNNGRFEEKIEINGDTFGILISGSMDFKINEYCGIQFSGTCIGSYLTRYKIETDEINKKIKLDKEDYKNLSRFELNVGFFTLK